MKFPFLYAMTDSQWFADNREDHQKHYTYRRSLFRMRSFTRTVDFMSSIIAKGLLARHRLILFLWRRVKSSKYPIIAFTMLGSQTRYEWCSTVALGLEEYRSTTSCYKGLTSQIDLLVSLKISLRNYHIYGWHWCNVLANARTKMPLSSLCLVAWCRPITGPWRAPNESPFVWCNVTAKLLKIRATKTSRWCRKNVGAEAADVLRTNFKVDHCLRPEKKEILLSK